MISPMPASEQVYRFSLAYTTPGSVDAYSVTSAQSGAGDVGAAIADEHADPWLFIVFLFIAHVFSFMMRFAHTGDLVRPRSAAPLAWATDSGISMGLCAQPQVKIPGRVVSMGWVGSVLKKSELSSSISRVFASSGLPLRRGAGGGQNHQVEGFAASPFLHGYPRRSERGCCRGPRISATRPRT
jgi:hypothetical protein